MVIITPLMVGLPEISIKKQDASLSRQTNADFIHAFSTLSLNFLKISLNATDMKLNANGFIKGFIKAY